LQAAIKHVFLKTNWVVTLF